MDEGVRKELVDELISVIEGQKSEVSLALSNSIKAHISTKSPSECLELVKRDTSGNIIRRLPMEADTDYAKALIAFVRGKPFEGFQLDSALTDSTSEVVAAVFSEKLGEKSDEISNRIMPLIVSDERFSEGLSEAMVEAYSGPLPSHIRHKVVLALSSKLSGALTEAIDTTTTATIKASVIKVVSASVSSPVGIKIAAILVKSLSVALKPIIMKLLASSAFKAAIVSKLKGVVVGSILAAFFKIIGVKLGLSTGAFFMWVVLPIVLAWLAYEVTTFPRKLGEKVSESVVEDIENDFAETSRDIAESLVERIIVDGAGMMAEHLMDDEFFVRILDQSIVDARS